MQQQQQYSSAPSAEAVLQQLSALAAAVLGAAVPADAPLMEVCPGLVATPSTKYLCCSFPEGLKEIHFRFRLTCLQPETLDPQSCWAGLLQCDLG